MKALTHAEGKRIGVYDVLRDGKSADIRTKW